MSEYVIGVDIGTTSTKAVIYDLQGKVYGNHSVNYPLEAPTTSAAVQDPEGIFQAVITSVKQAIAKSEISPSQILCLSFSAAMHSLMAVDSGGKALTPSITWADNRSAKWAEGLKSDPQGREIYARTGTPIHPMSPLSKLIWLRHEQTEIWQQAAKFISIKEYIFWQLLEEYVVDYSIASATGLFNFNNLAWDESALEMAEIKSSQLSTPVTTTEVFRQMKPEYARQMGIDPNTPIVIGANDGVLANLGVGAIAPGVVAVTLGTSGAVRTTIKRPQTDPEGRLFCYALTEDYWVIGGAVNNGGIALGWVKDLLGMGENDQTKSAPQGSYDLLTEIASQIPPGSAGLIFHPYLTGERSPLWNAEARGSFFGLGLHHRQGHLVRAVLEGVIYNLYSVWEILEAVVGEVNSIRAAGGFAHSSLWRQILADIFARDVYIPQNYESSCLGAAILGMYALEAISDLNQSRQINDICQYQPIAENVAIYQKILPLYSRLLASFSAEYRAIAQLQSQLA